MNMRVATVSDCPRPSGDVVAALFAHSGWHSDLPPVGATADADVDRRLADAFRALAGLPDHVARLAWIESETAVPALSCMSPPPADPYRIVLMRWWLQIFREVR